MVPSSVTQEQQTPNLFHEPKEADDEITVSFVVIAYNEAKNISKALEAIIGQTGLNKYEVIVVNDGSRDGTAEVVAQWAQRSHAIRLIDLPKNRGRGHARYTGVTATRGAFIATVDADIILPQDWFVRASTALLNHDAVGGTAVPDGDVSYVYQTCRLVPRTVGHATTVTGSNALYRRKVFELVNFDASLREGEDVALNKATAEHKISLSTVPGLLVEHIEHKTFTQSLAWLFVTGKGATRQLLTYRQVRTPDIAALIFWLAVALGIITAVFGWLLMGFAIPIIVLLAISAQHTRSRFEVDWNRFAVVAAAVAVDASMLLAYFAGRLVGLTPITENWSQAARIRRSMKGNAPLGQ